MRTYLPVVISLYLPIVVALVFATLIMVSALQARDAQIEEQKIQINILKGTLCKCYEAVKYDH